MSHNFQIGKLFEKMLLFQKINGKLQKIAKNGKN